MQYRNINNFLPDHSELVIASNHNQLTGNLQRLWSALFNNAPGTNFNDIQERVEETMNQGSYKPAYFNLAIDQAMKDNLLDNIKHLQRLGKSDEEIILIYRVSSFFNINWVREILADTTVESPVLKQNIENVLAPPLVPQVAGIVSPIRRKVLSLLLAAGASTAFVSLGSNLLGSQQASTPITSQISINSNTTPLDTTLRSQHSVPQQGVILTEKSKAPSLLVGEEVVEKPVVEEPVVQEPVVQEPLVQEPIVQEPVVEEPVVEEPRNVETLEPNNQSLQDFLSEYKGDTFKILFGDSDSEAFKVVVDHLRRKPLTPSELISLKLIRSANLKRFSKTNLERLAFVYSLPNMSDSDNWFIRLLKDRYEENSTEIDQRFAKGNFYQGINAAIANTAKNADFMKEIPELRSIILDPAFIEAIMIVEGGFRARQMSAGAQVEITRSLIDSGHFNPNFGAYAKVVNHIKANKKRNRKARTVTSHKLRLWINHVLTSVFIKNGRYNNEATIDYLKEQGVIRLNPKTKKPLKPVRIIGADDFNTENLADPSKHAPAEHKLVDNLLDPQDSVELTLAIMAEIFDVCHSVFRDEGRKEKILAYAEVVPNFWLKVAAMGNLLGGNKARSFLTELTKHSATLENFNTIITKKVKNDEGELVSKYNSAYPNMVVDRYNYIRENPAVSEEE